MDRRFLTVLGVSLLFALVVSSVFYSLTRASGPKGSDPGDMKDIVVAMKPLSVGTTVKAADVKLSRMSIASFPKTAFSKVEDAIDRPVISNILLDEPLLEGRLGARGSGQGLAPTIPVGMRAVSVRVNDVASVAGFVLPGMRVDVLVTGRPPSSDSTVTNTILQNMLVLSAGTMMQPDARGQAVQAPTVTLLANPEQAEILTLANSQGGIQLVLRNGSDQTIEKTQATAVAQLYGGKGWKLSEGDKPKVVYRTKTITAPAAAPPPPPPPPDQVIVIRGDKRSVETVPNRPESRQQ